MLMLQAKKGYISHTVLGYFVPVFLFIFISFYAAQGQLLHEKGVPTLHNYAPGDYLNSGKIWDIASGPEGLVYMAADKGLLEFDGEVWRRFKGSAGFIRSLHVVHDSLIYTGSDLEFGI